MVSPSLPLLQSEVQIGDSVYDVSLFASMHPGGEQFVSMFGGMDATAAYYSYHGHKSVGAKLLPYRVREATPAYEVGHVNSEAYQRLRARVNKAIPFTNANFQMWAKCVALIAIEVLLELSMLVWGPRLLLSVALGVVIALIGLNIQHDANHGAFSKDPEINFALGLMQDYIGGSALLWRIQHDVLHHVLTNHRGRDPDHEGLPLVQFAMGRRDTPSWAKQQHLYIIPALCLLPVNWCFLSVKNLIELRYFNVTISFMNARFRDIALYFRAFFWCRLVLLPLWLRPGLHTTVCIALVFATAGISLGIFFLLSHNFVGVAEVEGSGEPKKHQGKVLSAPAGTDKGKLDWAGCQVVTSATWGGPIAGFLIGGLNYQIEHHLFPRICSCHYPTLAPIL
eukprot:RCo038053